MSHETHQPPLFVFDGNVPHVTPIHNTGREIDEVAGADSEEIG